LAAVLADAFPVVFAVSVLAFAVVEEFCSFAYRVAGYSVTGVLGCAFAAFAGVLAGLGLVDAFSVFAVAVVVADVVVAVVRAVDVFAWVWVTCEGFVVASVGEVLDGVVDAFAVYAGACFFEGGAVAGVGAVDVFAWVGFAFSVLAAVGAVF
jgi:hypothetical protein